MPAKKTTTNASKPASTKPAKANKKVASKMEAPANETAVVTAPVETKPAKPTKPAKAPKADKPKKVSALDAAAKVLAEEKEPLTTKEMIEAMVKKGYWNSPAGKTPHATLYSAILREIQTKGTEARFMKTERGHFKLAGN